MLSHFYFPRHVSKMFIKKHGSLLPECGINGLGYLLLLIRSSCIKLYRLMSVLKLLRYHSRERAPRWFGFDLQVRLNHLSHRYLCLKLYVSSLLFGTSVTVSSVLRALYPSPVFEFSHHLWTLTDYDWYIYQCSVPSYASNSVYSIRDIHIRRFVQK